MNTLQKLSTTITGVLFITLQAVNPIQAVTLASAELGSTGQNIGTFIAPFQFQGWRFNLDTPFEVKEIGGHISTVGDVVTPPNEPIFGAIVQLNNSNALPEGNPFLPEEVVASTTFIPTELSSDIRVPLSVTLNPGSYGLVFGSGLFGATGLALMPLNNTSFPDSTYFTYSSVGTWGDNTLSPNLRFVVEGNQTIASTPEPSSIVGFLILGSLGISSIFYRKLKHYGQVS